MQNPFGTTGERFPVLSFRAQRIVDSHECSEDKAVRMINQALDSGIRYFDTAWICSGSPAQRPACQVSRGSARMSQGRHEDVPVAQWIEQLPSKQWVVRSSRTRDATDSKMRFMTHCMTVGRQYGLKLG